MTDMMMPGDRLATSEEYIPGKGTYEHMGIIYAAVMGERDFDEKEKVASIKCARPIGTLGADDIVLGEVISVSNSVARIRIAGPENAENPAGRNLIGALHVSRIMADYVNDARHHFRIGDLVRARVEQVEPSVQLATDDEELGVLKARCLRCRAILYNRDGKLFCPACERGEDRKVAGDFHRYTPYHYD